MVERWFRNRVALQRRLAVVGLVAGALLLGDTLALEGSDRFRRGDGNADGVVDLSDAVYTFGYLFLGDSAPGCLDATDANDNGELDLSDGVFVLNFLFLGRSEPPPPGPLDCGDDPTADLLDCTSYSAPGCEDTGTDLREVGHVLNRLGYGPSPESVSQVLSLGLEAYVQEQLNPETIDESDNLELLDREAALFVRIQPSQDRRLVGPGDAWRYFKGTSEPSPDSGDGSPTAEWTRSTFNDGSWPVGASGIGYGDGDDATVLDDMQNGYVSVYLRKSFQVEDPSRIHELLFRVDYDDGFVAYLNGTEIARRGLSGSPPGYAATASSHEAGTPEELDITARKSLLVAGENVLAVQGHNSSAGSSDFTILPELIDREILPLPPIDKIESSAALQELIHVRGIYSRRQLQAVLGEFWENHFTTDIDKVTEYFDALQNSDASNAMTESQARDEAAQAEYREYEFFYQNALGNFGDLLLFSATSPAMLVYLDSVLNVKGAANENYAREICELHALGVDHGYTQIDIEQLAKCFTGWTICKIPIEDRPGFPESSRDPPVDCGVKFDDEVVVGLGTGWRYFKGSAEPSPAPSDGSPTLDWTLPEFDDSSWLAGSTGIGYGDGDDATVLSDMRGSYRSVYLRRTFQVADPDALSNFIFEVAYDDGFVAYLNGVEIARSESMQNTGTPPAHDALTRDGHEVSEGVELFSLEAYRHLLLPDDNVLGIQVHNSSEDSSDLSMLPRLLEREVLPGSVENGDPNGVWTFRFLPDLHDASRKVLFEGTPHRLEIPAGRTGIAGLQDAIEVIDALVAHPSTAEFICIKLIQRLVSDDVTLADFKAGTVPQDLVDLLATATDAWFSTSPPGNIETVVEAVLDPVNRSTVFWSERYFGAKVKSPVEFINSTVRVLAGGTVGIGLRNANSDMGMSFFSRDDPDGWPEIGLRWIDTASMLARIDFAQGVAGNREPAVAWATQSYLEQAGAQSAGEIVDLFSDLLFQGEISPDERALLLEFLTTDDDYTAAPLSPSSPDYVTRVEEFTGFLLSLPRWQFQ